MKNIDRLIDQVLEGTDPDEIVDVATGEIPEDPEKSEAKGKEPKNWDSMFAMNVIKAYKKKEFKPKDPKSILAWDTKYNAGKAPKPAFNTKEIIDYYIATGVGPDGNK